VRRFDVFLEGKEVLHDYDGAGTAGFATADPHSFDVAVEDGLLDISFGRRKDNPHLSAIEVEPER
jgi:hypothetical protein